MAKVLNNEHKNALDMLLQAAARSADCTNGLLVRRDLDHWEQVARYGAEQPGSFESSIDDWLVAAFTSGDLVILNEVLGQTLPMWFHRIRHAGQVFFVGVAVRDKQANLVGVIFVTSADPLQRLSAAQTYALQTHAAIISEFFKLSAETALRSNSPSIERLRLLESVVVNAKDAILITEAEPIGEPGPRIVYCNPAFLSTTGFNASEVIGKTPRILQCEETSRETLDLIREALSKWQPIEVELINTRSDGSRFWVQLSIVPVANERGWFTHWVSVQRDITERKEADSLIRQGNADREEKVALETRLLERERIEEELSYAAFHDDLTSLYNRAYLMSRLLSIFTKDGSSQAPAATVLFLDLDRFKYVNDSLGHRAGDLLLTVVARRLEMCIREEDVFARVGGDEFAILLEGEGQLDLAIELAQRIVTRLRMPVVIDGQDIFTSCSLGIVSADLSHASPEDLLRDADVAMYAAKKQGRGRWAIFDASMRKAAVDALLMQNALKQAIARDELSVVYQPIYNVATGEISGVEALVRWLHPELGHVPPDVFISVAEDNGVIHELGGWVMLQACTELQRWKGEFSALGLHLNVNVSGNELNRPGYVAQVARILLQTGIAPHELQIEITESVFLHEPDETAKVLESVRELGIRVALDDFGTGYSSLGYIDRYPIDAIKIDRSFVSRMMSYDRSDAIVRSILSLGRTLGLGITAEGVETLAQLQRLKEMECPFVQGYLLSPPVRAEEVTTLLRAWTPVERVACQGAEASALDADGCAAHQTVQ
ncbi:bifunctional diguanylate cyclase/phosphodiesterase [Pseudomonas sp. Irchel 3A5]|uniref:putative bifunctional diguanylate cyclase/phosphodiesterase n=1 Tax=Pseudomonas sp. Irchel 3A5 TaxID=2008911 RepID=UPI000BA3CD2F|nr:GGDEF domain-containing phosphodiesterase [Pseudomonas sp. Irchel 3A5]